MWARTVSGLHSRSSSRDPISQVQWRLAFTHPRGWAPYEWGKIPSFYRPSSGLYALFIATVLKDLDSAGVRSAKFLSHATINRVARYRLRQRLHESLLTRCGHRNTAFPYFPKCCAIEAACSAAMATRGYGGTEGDGMNPIRTGLRRGRRVRRRRRRRGGRYPLLGGRARRERRVRVDAGEIQQQGFEPPVVFALIH